MQWPVVQQSPCDFSIHDGACMLRTCDTIHRDIYSRLIDLTATLVQKFTGWHALCCFECSPSCLLLHFTIVECGVQVIKLISQVIADFADGEIDQSSRLFDTETTMEVPFWGPCLVLPVWPWPSSIGLVSLVPGTAGCLKLDKQDLLRQFLVLRFGIKHLACCCTLLFAMYVHACGSGRNIWTSLSTRRLHSSRHPAEAAPSSAECPKRLRRPCTTMGAILGWRSR